MLVDSVYIQQQQLNGGFPANKFIQSQISSLNALNDQGAHFDPPLLLIQIPETIKAMYAYR
jgi:hypothetical protein